MQPVKPAMKSKRMQSVESAVLQSDYKKKNQAKQVSVYDDKNCQFTQSIHMQPVKSATKSSHMQSVTKSSHKQSVEPAMIQSTYKKFSQVSLCADKNCQSTKSVSDDKN